MEKVNFYYGKNDITEQAMNNLERCVNMISFSSEKKEEAKRNFFFSTTFNKYLETENEMWMQSPYEIWEEYNNEPKTLIVINNQDITKLVQKEFNKTIDKIVKKYGFSLLEAACVVRKSEIYSFLNETEPKGKRRR